MGGDGMEEEEAVASELWAQGGTLYPKFRTCTLCIPKSKMRLMSKFQANDFNYKIV